MNSDPSILLLKTFCDFLSLLKSKNFIHTSNECSLCIYCVPISVLGARDTAVSKIDENFCPHGTDIIVEETENKIHK